MLCYVMLCYVMLCYVMLRYVMLCCVVLCCVVLCCVVLCCVVLCCVVLCYVMLSERNQFESIPQQSNSQAYLVFSAKCTIGKWHDAKILSAFPCGRTQHVSFFFRYYSCAVGRMSFLCCSCLLV